MRMNNESYLAQITQRVKRKFQYCRKFMFLKNNFNELKQVDLANSKLKGRL